MDYNKQKMDRLKDLCKSNNLSTEGKKDDLIKRLQNFDKQKMSKLAFDGEDQQTVAAEPMITEAPSYGSIDRKSFFIPMKTENLSRYLNAGVIYPLYLEANQIYKNENRKPDQFNADETIIPIIIAPSENLKDDEILIEIYANRLVLSNSNADAGLLIDTPLPISRIIQILFSSEKSRQSFLASGIVFPDFFIEPSMLAVLRSPIQNAARNFQVQERTISKKLEDWKPLLARYDRVIGMFGFMKNVGIFFSEKENQYQQYTPTFFSALSMINSAFSPPNNRDLGLYRYILFPEEIDDKNTQRLLFKRILQSIYANEDFSINLGRNILEEILSSNVLSNNDESEISGVVTFLMRLQAYQVSHNEILKNESIRRNLPILALLMLVRFPNKSRQHTDKQAARVFLMTNEVMFPKSVIEFLLSILGLYYGYKNMIKQDTNLKLKDPYFIKLTEKQQSVKFRANSKLERAIMESVFEWSLNRNPLSDSFDYMTVEKTEILHDLHKWSWSGNEYVNRSVRILGEEVTAVERKSRITSLLEIVEKTYPTKVSYKSSLVHHLLSVYGVDKATLLQWISSNKEKIDVEHLNTLITLDKFKS